MRIILEGPDNSGKTTLAQHIAQACKELTYFHPGSRPTNMAAEMQCVLEQVSIMKSNKHSLLDRVTVISHQIYSPNEEPDLTMQYHLDQLLANERPVVIYCRPSNDRLMRFQDFTWRGGETEEFKQSIIRNQHRYIEAYDKLMLKVPHITYNFDDPTGNVIRDKLIKAVNGSSDDEAWFYNLMTYRI